MARILIIEDDEWQRKLLKAFVVSLGHESRDLDHGSQTLAVIQEFRPDILLLDWELPGQNGLEICHEIRSRRHLPYVYIIFLTAHTDRNCLVDALRTGGDDFISKPANTTELQARISAGLRILQTSRQERQRIEEQLRQAQKLESIGRLVGGIAHDFNNLLTVINGYAQFAQSDLPTESPVQDSLTQIESAGIRAALLSRQLLTFSRKNAPVAVAMNLNSQIQSIVRMVERIVGEDIRIETRMEPDLWTVKCDPSSIDQVLMNLVVNARDAMPNGGRISLITNNVPGETPKQDAIELVVEDTGTGMTEEVRTRLFEPFFSTKGEKGTGLGLSTVHDVVQQSGGSITVESVLGEGSRFRIRLPRTEVASQSAETLPVESSPRKGGQRILIVEDDPNVLKWGRLTLEREGYEVFEAETATKALQVMHYRGVHLDCILTDVMLTDSTGPDLVEKLRRQNPAIRAVFMSGYPREWLDARTSVFTQDVFLEKPLNAKDLIEKIRSSFLTSDSVAS